MSAKGALHFFNEALRQHVRGDVIQQFTQDSAESAVQTHVAGTMHTSLNYESDLIQV